MKALKQRLDVPAVIGVVRRVKPDLMLETGLYECVVIGQGELIFRDVVNAIASGESLESIEGIAFMKDGEVIRPGAARGRWDQVPNVPRHLLDPEPYREHQMRAQSARDGRPRPRPDRPRQPYFGITYFSRWLPRALRLRCSPEISMLEVHARGSNAR